MSVNGQPCKWWKHAEVVAQLKGVGDEGASLQVVTLLPSAEPPGTVSPGALGGWPPAPLSYPSPKPSSRPQTSPGAKRALERGGWRIVAPTGVAFRAPVLGPPPGCSSLPPLRPQPTSQVVSPHSLAPSRSTAAGDVTQRSPAPAHPTHGGPTAWPPSQDPPTCQPPASLSHSPGWPQVGQARVADCYVCLSQLQGDRRPALGGLLRSQKECGWETPAPARASPRPLLGWGRKAKRGKTGERLSPAPHP